MRQPWHPRARARARHRRWLTLSVVASLATLPAAWRAAAFFSDDGAGSAGGGVLTMAPASSSATGAAGALHPGGDGDLTVTVTNPNAFSVVVASVSRDSSTAVSSSAVGCDGAALVTFSAPSVPATTVGAGATTDVVLTAAVHLAASAPQACQGATFSIPLLVAVRR